jgi:pilus assembly protein FimV
MSYKMNNYKRLQMSSLGRKLMSAAVASSFLLLPNAYATGLGRLTVLSALGQPLRAEIELTSPDKDEVASLVPKLASAEAFRQSSIDFNPALLSLRFAVESRGAGYVIRVSSTQAMNEPFVDLLLEMNSSNGRLLREYTFLLDPAELRNSQSAQVANPVSVTTSSSAVKTPAQEKSAVNASQTNGAPVTSRRVPAKVVEVAKEVKSASDYQIKRGDTLSKIAGEFKAGGVSLDQMLVGLYKANPQAFAGGNMNRLKSGQILSIPDADAVRASTAAESHSIVMAHAADFSSYRNRLAGQVSDAPAQKATDSKQAASGTITAKVKEVPTATSESLDKLKLSKALPGAAVKPGEGKASLEEDKLAKDKAVAEANARVKELEKNVGDLQKILEIKNKDLAEKQSAAKASVSPAAASATVATADASAASVAAPASVAVVTAPASAPAVVAPVAKRKIAPPPPPPEPNWYDNWGDWLLPATAVLALLGGYGLFSSRRKKKTQHFDDSVLTGSSMKANSMFGSTGGQSVDTNNSVFNSNFAPSASQLDANEVDPVAEADVYIAYGRDSQAEEILKEALRTQPERHAVRVKLLEIYFSRKDPRSFERLASELYGMTSGEGEEWAQAASMGVTLEPTNPLYAGGKNQAEALGVASGLGVSTQPLEDLDPESLLGNSLSQDMLDSISIIDTASGLTGEPSVEVSDFSGAKSAESDAVLDIGSLDFDLDIPGAELVSPLVNDFSVPMVPEEAPVDLSVEHKYETPVVDFGVIDFDLGTNEFVPELKSELKSEQLQHDTSDLGLSSDSFLDSEPVDSNEIAFESVESFGKQNIDELEVDHLNVANISPVEAEVVAPAFEFDLSGINLDLGEESKQGIDEPLLDASSSYNAEMATKLDLAVAYQEIGDKEGARELLDEVVKGGTQDQIEKAQTMLAQLM